MRYKMRNLEGQVPNMRLSSKEIINPELSNQTNGLPASNSTLQYSGIVPDFHTSKEDVLFRPEQEKREQMQHATEDSSRKIFPQHEVHKYNA